MNNWILVVAGNRTEHDVYERENPTGRYVYYTGVHSIIGRRFSEVRFIGSWWINPPKYGQQTPSEFLNMLAVASGYDYYNPIVKEPDIQIETSL